MRCFKCGLQKSGPYNPNFQCEDCMEFSPLVIEVWNDVAKKFDTLESFDLDAHGILRLLADTTFVTATNPQIRIFYRVCETLIAEVLKGNKEMTDSQLARSIRTTRGFADVFRIFSELNLIKVRNEKYHRVLVFQDKLMKMAQQFLTGGKISEQVTKRLAHIYSSYVLLYLMSIVANMKNDGDTVNLPYGKRPQSLWVVLMFLWETAYNHKKEFFYEDMRVFFARRGLTSSVTDIISGRLQAVDGKTIQGMIKEFDIGDDGITFTFEDYVVKELERFRLIEREREQEV